MSTATAVALWGCSGGAPTPVDLAAAERSAFSPAGQDGVLEKIFEVIEPQRRYLVELGAGDGRNGSLSRNLIENHGWSALLVEPDPELGARLEETYADAPAVETLRAAVDPGDVEIRLGRAGVPADLDLLSVNLQGNDWYVWRAIRELRPRVVQIEYNAAFVPPQTMVIEYHPLNRSDGRLYFGASLQSLYDLAQRKGYELVYADRSGTTAYFVDRPYYRRFGLDDNEPAELYAPRPGFPRITPADVWYYVYSDGRVKSETYGELVVEDVVVPRYWVVGEY